MELNVAMIGYGFMGKAHSNAFLSAGKFFDLPLRFNMKVICGRTENKVRAVQEQWGWEEYALDWKQVIRRKDIDVVDIATPNSTHVPIILESAKHKKHVLCEKPMGISVSECRKALEAVKKAGISHMIWHNYRKAPALVLARKLIDEGQIGRVFHVRASFLADSLVSLEYPLTWRLREESSGTGALGDIGVHLIDTARFLVGEITGVSGMLETFIKERPLPDHPKKKGEVTVDDAASFLCRFENSAMGVFEATRYATGRKAQNSIEVNGSKGALAWSTGDLNTLEFYSLSDEAQARGPRKIHVTEKVHPYMQGYWPPGHSIGYEHTFINALKDFANDYAQGKAPSPNLEDGLRNQMVLEAVLKSSKTRSWVKVE